MKLQKEKLVILAERKMITKGKPEKEFKNSPPEQVSLDKGIHMVSS